jgi:hypothetical protein
MTHFCRATAYCTREHKHLLAYYRAQPGQERHQGRSAILHRYPSSQPSQIHITIMEKHDA